MLLDELKHLYSCLIQPLDLAHIHIEYLQIEEVELQQLVVLTDLHILELDMEKDYINLQLKVEDILPET